MWRTSQLQFIHKHIFFCLKIFNERQVSGGTCHKQKFFPVLLYLPCPKSRVLSILVLKCMFALKTVALFDLSYPLGLSCFFSSKILKYFIVLYSVLLLSQGERKCVAIIHQSVFMHSSSHPANRPRV